MRARAGPRFALPTGMRSTVFSLLLLLALGSVSGIPGSGALPLSTRIAIGFGVAIIAPVLNLISLLIPNAAVLLFPSWFQTGKDAPAGIEAMGQRLIFVFGQVLVMALALAPAAGPRLSVAHRTGLPGSGANAVRLEAAYAPTWRVGDEHVTHEAGASLQVEWWLGRAGPFGVLLTPRAWVRWEGALAPALRR